MAANNVEEIMGGTMDQIKKMVDADTIIGKAIECVDGTTIVPISKVTYGFGSGGADIASKNNPTANLFGGGGGAGVSIIPVAFLTVHQGNVKVVQVEPYTSSVDRAIEVVPDAVQRIIEIFKKNKEDKKEKSQEISKETEDIVKDLKKQAEELNKKSQE